MLDFHEIDDRKAYRTERADLLTLLEGSTLKPYVDSVGDPTIGIGFNLVYNLEPVLRVIVGARNWSDTLLQRLEAEVARNYAPGDNATLIANLDRVMADWHDTKDSDVPETFSFRNERKVAKALDALAPTYDAKIDDWLAGIPDSQERAALFSLCWNAPSLLGPKLKAAIEDGNRAEAWYEIRYNSNGNAMAGLANRRYVEAETFGLFEDDGLSSWREALDTGRMLAGHHETVLRYEDRYDPIEAAEIKGVPGIETIHDEIAPSIKTALRKIGLPTRTDVDELLAASSSGTEIAGDGTSFDDAGNDQDLILGAKGDDRLSGNSGADILAGRKGADMLTGGGGADLFVFSRARESSAKAFDTIADFGTGADRIALTRMGDFVFLADIDAEFTGSGPQIRWFWSGGDTVIEADADSDGSADLRIVLVGETALDESDFFL